MWGGITEGSRTPLFVIDGNLTGIRYRDIVIQTTVLLFIEDERRHGRRVVAQVVATFLQDNNVDVLDWPAVLPDLNPIEHMWVEMERRLRRLPNQP